jgi:CDP-glucose 4,6-dehydratase
MDKSFWQNKKVFITGHTGFKGSWLSLWLSAKGAEIYGYALPPSSADGLFASANIDNLMENSIWGDITELECLKNAMVAANPDIVIHMAAQALVRDSYLDPIKTYTTNVMGTANVLESAKSCKNVRAILVITTDKCYENKEWYWGYREQDPLGGYDPYSSSKACAEIVTAAYRQSFLKDSNIAVSTVRAGNVIGGGDWAKDRLIPDCLRAVEAGKKISIRSPEAIRPWQHVLEPLHGYLMLIEKLYLEGQVWAESWNFGPNDSGVFAVGDLVEKLCGKLNATYELKKTDNLHEAKYLKLDCSKANMRLGWKSILSIDMAIDYIVEWFEAYRRGDDLRAISLEQINKYTTLLQDVKIGEEKFYNDSDR